MSTYIHAQFGLANFGTTDRTRSKSVVIEVTSDATSDEVIDFILKSNHTYVSVSWGEISEDEFHDSIEFQMDIYLRV